MMNSQQNNLQNLRNKLKKIKCKLQINYEEVAEGDPIVFLRIINYILLEYSQEMVNLLLEKGYELYAKKDNRFIEKVFQLCLNLFKYKPKITVEQFFTVGYGDQKVILCLEIINNVKTMIKSKNNKTKNISRQNNDSLMSMRSASLKPRRLDLKEETVANTLIPTNSEFNMHKDNNIPFESHTKDAVPYPLTMKPQEYENK